MCESETLEPLLLNDGSLAAGPARSQPIQRRNKHTRNNYFVVNYATDHTRQINDAENQLSIHPVAETTDY